MVKHKSKTTNTLVTFELEMLACMTTLNASLSNTKRLGTVCHTCFDTNEDNAVPLYLSFTQVHKVSEEE
jgi:hypothetical protein